MMDEGRLLDFFSRAVASIREELEITLEAGRSKRYDYYLSSSM